VSLFDQGLIQVLQASVTGLEPGKPYVVALSRRRDGRGALEPPRAGTPVERRYLVIAAGTPAQLGPVVQTQVD
jgi:hypothetical protein